jgi:hypothetical protein
MEIAVTADVAQALYLIFSSVSFCVCNDGVGVVGVYVQS